MRADILRLKNVVGELANRVTTVTQDTIQRELRLLALQQRAVSPDHETYATFTNRKSILAMADQFLSDCKNSARQNINENTVFSLLAEWFDSRSEIQAEATQLAVIAWRSHINKHFPPTLNARDFIRIAASYFNEPYKLVAHIGWLVENDVTPVEIINTYVLHQFYDACHPEIILSTYALLSQFSENNNGITPLMRYLTDVPCAMHGLVNIKEKGDVPRFFSRNVMGVDFFHDELFENLPSYKNTSDDETDNKIQKLVVTDEIAEKANALFVLFDWSFISIIELNSTLFSHELTEAQEAEINKKTTIAQKALLAIFRSQQSRIMNDLHVIFSTGVANLTATEIGKIEIIHSFFETMATCSEFQSVDYVQTLIKENPFYVHILGFLLDAVTDAIPASELNYLWQEVLSKGFYTCIPQLFHLAYLWVFLSSEEKFFDVAFKIKNFIFESLMQNYALLNDVIAEKIVSYVDMTDLAEARLNAHFSEINTLVADMVSGKIDYAALEMIWGTKAAEINFIFEIDETLKQRIAYPYTCYGLKGAVLEASWLAAEQSKNLFDCQSVAKKILRETIAEDEDALVLTAKKQADIKRILLESLVFSKNILFINHILNVIHQMEGSFDFLLKDFGEDKNLFNYAIKKNNVLLKAILTDARTEKLRNHFRKDWNLIVLQFLISAWRFNNSEAFRLFHEKKWITRARANKILMTCYVNKHREKTEFDDQMIMYFCNMRLLQARLGPDDKHFIKVLKIAMENNRTNLVWMLYKHDSYVSFDSVALAFEFYIEKSHWVYLNEMVKGINDGTLPHKMRSIQKKCQEFLCSILENASETAYSFQPFFATLGPILSVDVIRAGIDYAVCNHKIGMLPALCGLTGDLHRHCSSIIENDAVTYFNAVMRYFETPHSVQMERNLLTCHFFGGNTLLHHMMKQDAPDVLKAYFDHLKMLLNPQEFYGFLNHSNDHGQIAHSDQFEMTRIYLATERMVKRELESARKDTGESKRQRETEEGFTTSASRGSSAFFAHNNRQNFSDASDEDIALLLGKQTTHFQPGKH